MQMRQMTLTSVALALVTLVANSSLAGPILYGLGNQHLFQEVVNDPNAATNHSLLYTINTTTGAATLVGDTGFNLRGLSYNPLTGRAYGSVAEIEAGGGLYEINLATGAATFIGGTQNFSKMDFDGSGNLVGYGTRAEPNAYNFYSIDVNTGNGTLLNSNAISTGHVVFDIAYSSADNEMYFYQQLDGGPGDGLWTVDTTDGTLTSVVSGVLQQYRPDIAADASGNLFAIDREHITSLYTLDKTTGNTSFVGLNGVGLNSIAFADDVSAVPEPATMALLGLTGLGGLGLRLRRRRMALSL